MIAIQLPTIHYSTISYTRLISVDMPFADQHRGVPFGEKNGPAIALIGAIGSISAGAALGGFLGGVIIAGGIFSGIGALTGNKTLSTIGGVLSLAGGIGSAFTNATTGEFMNPFAEGASFGDTKLGAGFTKVKNFFSGEAVGASDATAALNIDGGSVIESASGIDPNTIESTGGSIRDEFNNVISGPADAFAAPAAKSGGLLSSLGGSKDLLSLISGASDGYTENQKLEQQQPLFDARIKQANAETDLLNNRYNNLQSQPNVGINVNENAQVFNQAPGTSGEGKYAVVLNGEVKYVTQAEYDAMRQNQGGGLLNQGMTA